MITDKKITFDSFIRGILGGGFIIFILYLLNRLSGVLLPFFIAWIIAYLTYPMVIFYQNKLRIRNRVLSILAVIITLILIGIAISMFFVPPMMDELAKLRVLIEEYVIENKNHSAIPDYITQFIHENVDYHRLKDIINPDNISQAIHQLLPQIESLLSTSYSIIGAIFTAFVMLLYFVFILLDYEQIADGWINLLPIKHKATILAIVNDVKDSMNKYFRGQATVAFCVGILFSIGFLIIDFPLAIGLGLFIGLLNMVPDLQIIGFIPTILLAVLKAADTGENFWWIMLLAIIVFGVVQFIQDAFIVPKIMGKITGLNPAIILLSLSIWGSLMGVLGMIIALPCTTLLLSYYQKYIHSQDTKINGRTETTENQDSIPSTEK